MSRLPHARGAAGWAWLWAACLACGEAAPVQAAEAPGNPPMRIERRARDTLTAVELSRGDTLEFTLRNGQTRRLTLDDTAARVLATNLRQPGKARGGGGTLYHFTCRVRIDGHPMTMERYVGAQESFYEPCVVNGMRIWLDAVGDIFDFLTEKHGECKPAKDARLAVSDAADPICPQEVQPWYPSENPSIDVRDCYCGDDCWLGAYQGADAHGGLDVNMPKGTPHWAPIDFDDHYYFNSLAMGHNNNRWRATRTWPDGTIWTLQSHHLIKLLVPEHTPLRAGTHYAEAAGVHVGAHEHSHFVFKITEGAATVLLDPWILFHEMFENRRRKAGALRAAMAPLSPAKAGHAVAFRSLAPDATCFWTFGDGGWASGANPTHTFLKPGIYPVTLTVDHGADRASCTQHITVDGEAPTKPGLALAAPDELSFRRRPVHAMDVYGSAVREIPRTIELVARPSRTQPRPRTIVVENTGGGTLPLATATVAFESGADWLTATHEGKGNAQRLTLRADAKALEPGAYAAVVSVDCPGATNSPQACRIVLRVAPERPTSRVTITTRDPGFYATPYFWTCPGYHTWPKGRSGFVLTNGARATEGEFARFTPDLAAGKHDVSLSSKTPFKSDVRFAVRIRHKSGEEQRWIEPARSRVIGTFEFEEGADGFVEILAAGSTGQVLADALTFAKID